MHPYKEKICIIGAGPGGIAAGAALKAAGMPFDIIDKGRQVGGMWDYDRPDTPLYRNAHFISSKTLSGFEDYPMPDAYPDYPSHELILQYIQDYARHHGLAELPEFERELTRVIPVEGGWEITLDQKEVRTYAGLIIANGRTWYPRMPEYPGTFTGETMHAFDYREPDRLRGKRVLVVGAGNSGCDIACDAAQYADQAWISMRRGYYFIPKYVMGKPSDVFADTGPTLPSWLEKPVFQFLLNKIVVGDLRQYGLPRPDHKIFETHPILNAHILHYLGHGDIAAKPDIALLDGKEVGFKDGTRETVDLIIYATGYRQAFPYFRAEDLPVNEWGIPDMSLNVFSRTYDHLFFLGFLETDGAAYPFFNRQAKLISDYWRLRRAGQQQVWPWLKDFQPNLQKGTHYLRTPRNAFYVKGRVYDRMMKKAQGQLSRWLAQTK